MDIARCGRSIARSLARRAGSWGYGRTSPSIGEGLVCWPFDERNLFKLSPLLDWTREAVQDFTAANRIPTNPLHKQGFVSIGCAPCTRAITAGEPERAGRWWWETDEKKECGLHERSLPAKILE